MSIKSMVARLGTWLVKLTAETTPVAPPATAPQITRVTEVIGGLKDVALATTGLEELKGKSKFRTPEGEVPARERARLLAERAYSRLGELGVDPKDIPDTWYGRLLGELSLVVTPVAAVGLKIGAKALMGQFTVLNGEWPEDFDPMINPEDTRVMVAWTNAGFNPNPDSKGKTHRYGLTSSPAQFEKGTGVRKCSEMITFKVFSWISDLMLIPGRHYSIKEWAEKAKYPSDIYNKSLISIDAKPLNAVYAAGSGSRTTGSKEAQQAAFQLYKFVEQENPDLPGLRSKDYIGIFLMGPRIRRVAPGSDKPNIKGIPVNRYRDGSVWPTTQYGDTYAMLLCRVEGFNSYKRKDPPCFTLAGSGPRKAETSEGAENVASALEALESLDIEVTEEVTIIETEE